MSKLEYPSFDEYPRGYDWFAYDKRRDTLRQKQHNPDYYTWHPIIECRKVIEYFPLNLGCAIKYIWRVANPQASKFDSIDKRIEDLNKAINYLKFEIERLTESQGK